MELNEATVKAINSLAAVQVIDDLEVGRRFTTKELFPIKQAVIPLVECHTLTGLVDFFDNIPGTDRDRAYFLVKDFDSVQIVSDVYGTEKQRDIFAIASAYEQDCLFDHYLQHESFMINILSRFVQDKTTEKILNILGGLKTEAGVKYADDGMSQTVTARTGITKVAEIDLPNPVYLRPFRTFTEIEQPQSAFVFRMKQEDGIACALYQADGSAWKNTAIASIKEFLRDELGEVRIIA